MTLVESFACLETQTEPAEITQESLSLIESLGLTGQQSILSRAPQEPGTARNPFRKIRNDELFVYKTLCPKECELKDYSCAPIPYRVLELAKLAVDTGIFDKGLFVWDKEAAPIKDPVLVAKRTPLGRTWGEELFIIARWGEELETFATLSEKALTIFREKMVARCNRALREVTARLNEFSTLSYSEAVARGPEEHLGIYV